MRGFVGRGSGMVLMKVRLCEILEVLRLGLAFYTSKLRLVEEVA
jgi:hypothetical protein